MKSAADFPRPPRMTSALAREISRAAGVEMFYDGSLRLWTLLHPRRNARGKAEAQYLPSRLLRGLSPAEFWRDFVCPAAGSQWEDLRDVGAVQIPYCVLSDMLRRMRGNLR